jgi:predicted dehydrogenase
MLMQESFGWAYIGARYIARQTAKAILKTKQHRIVSVYNRSFSRASDFATKYGAKPCRSIEEALDQNGVQGVYIATMANNHFAAAKECLERGKPVLLEKPFTINKAEADELVRIAKEKKVYLAEAMWTWFSPVARQIKSWLAGGEIGELTHITISYAFPVTWLFPRLLDPNLAGGALLDCGVYPLTYLYNLLGNPESILCEGVIKNGVDVEENITLRYPNGFSVSVVISIIKNRGGENVAITGTTGSIECPSFHMANKANLIQRGHKTVFKGNGGYDNEFSIVADEIVSGKRESEYVPLKATLDVMEIMDECRRQMNFRYPFEIQQYETQQNEEQ